MNVKIVNAFGVYKLVHIYAEVSETLDSVVVNEIVSLLDYTGFEMKSKISNGYSLAFRVVEKKDTLPPKLSL